MVGCEPYGIWNLDHVHCLNGDKSADVRPPAGTELTLTLNKNAFSFSILINDSREIYADGALVVESSDHQGQLSFSAEKGRLNFKRNFRVKADSLELDVPSNRDAIEFRIFDKLASGDTVNLDDENVCGETSTITAVYKKAKSEGVFSPTQGGFKP